MPMTGAAGPLLRSHSTKFILIAAPMFIMMGGLMHRSGVSERLFVALTPWFARVPGSLSTSTSRPALSCAATSGASLARGRDHRPGGGAQHGQGRLQLSAVSGLHCAGGTLGILIPPSINMIVYSVLAQTSVANIYAAGFIPGFLLALLFSGMVLLAVLIRPALVKGGRAGGPLWPARLTGLALRLPGVLNPK